MKVLNVCEVVSPKKKLQMWTTPIKMQNKQKLRKSPVKIKQVVEKRYQKLAKDHQLIQYVKEFSNTNVLFVEIMFLFKDFVSLLETNKKIKNLQEVYVEKLFTGKGLYI